MKHLFLLFILVFSLSLHAQSHVNDYSFVVVPESFEFSTEKNQFQLNTMTKFYLNKNGFNAFFQSELPRVSNCDGLYVDVISKGSFVFTKTIIYLKDCKGTVVFQSQEGLSKKKEYREAYQESLRDAFKSIERLNVNQTAIIYDNSTSNVEKAAAKRLGHPAIKETIIVEENENSEPNVKNTVVGIGQDGPEAKFTYYRMKESSYLLRKSNEGYFFYSEDSSNSLGLVLLGELKQNNSSSGFVISGSLVGDAFFQKNGDLHIKEKDALQVFTFQN